MEVLHGLDEVTELKEQLEERKVLIEDRRAIISR